MLQLLRFLKNQKMESILAPLFKMLEASFDLVVPLVMAQIINVGIAQGDTGYIIQRCILMILLGLIGLACSITAQFFAAKASVSACTELRHALLAKIQTLSFSQLDTISTSTLITRMTSDVNQVQNGLNLFLRLFLRSPFVVFGAMVLAFTVNVRGALIFVVTIPVLAAVAFTIMLRSRPMYANVQSILDRLTGITRENLTGARVIRAFGREDDEVARFEPANQELKTAQLRVGRLSALMNPLTYVIVNLAVVAIVRVSGNQVNIGQMEMGDVVVLVNYMSQVLVELVKLANLVIQIAKANACAGRVWAILNLQPEMQFGTQQVESKASEMAVEFSDVSLTYANAGAPSLSKINFTVPKGQTVGVIGGTGSGKTSLISLVSRFYDATEGTVKLFGRNISDYNKESLRKSISVVRQQAQLFTGTIRSNLLWGNGKADDDALWHALELAQADDFVKSKKLGLDELVEQGGRNFSGGQRQRLSIARSLVAQPEILIFDDSSSALDYATDARLRKALRTLPENVTVFIVSQRASSLSYADQIIVLDEGRMVGLGKHEELLKTCEVYRDIFESQFSSADGLDAKREGGTAQ